MNDINNQMGEQTIQTEQTNEDNGTQSKEFEKDTGVTDNGVSNVGKFKDVKDLLNAYNSLQAEFTRRCQKIKELERGVENLKQRTNEDSSFNEGEDFLKNLLGEELTKEKLSSLNQLADDEKDGSKYRLVKAYIKSLRSSVDDEQNTQKADKVIIITPEMKEEIIKEYLHNINAFKQEVTLMTGNGKSIVAPPLKPKSLADAGILARKILDN